ncbi:hypothetical protein MYAM1_000337 [Malassezia yamatoensis]|uniref:Probable RNA polymerase II nuclear localization protein SLC7A6OS n=1 Tax=Malassezia yamatoensis TaxID=253288 RepID=A0AAJ5YP49_9BASI|nr:hypothetical protein MYAM1_000337 [Malassezia yamatoensis]
MNTVGNRGTNAEAILRVKRKRGEDPIDAFVVHSDSRQTKFRSQNAGREIGMFRLAQTQADASAASTSQKIIEAEWDSSKKRIAIKRKREEDSIHEQSSKIPHTGYDQHGPFSGMLADYLKLNLGENNKKAEEFVYDIYYRETLPSEWRVTTSRPVVRNQPPSIGRAKSGGRASFSPVPLPRTQQSSTTAPGFEHLAKHHAQEKEYSGDTFEDEDFIPVFLRSAINDAGHTEMVPVTTSGQRLEETLLLDEERDAQNTTLEEDEDSNDEDFYGNEYPDRDEWDAESAGSFASSASEF